MFDSPYQIDFLDAAGNATRLLDIGDGLSSLFDFSARQSAETYISLGVKWGGGRPGGARRPLTWTRGKEHASHAAAASFCIRHPAAVPLTREGKLRIVISGGETWDMLDAVILEVGARLDSAAIFGTLGNYQCEAGETVPVSGLAHYSGMPHAWILTAAEDQTRIHSNM